MRDNYRVDLLRNGGVKSSEFAMDRNAKQVDIEASDRTEARLLAEKKNPGWRVARVRRARPRREQNEEYQVKRETPRRTVSEES